MHDLHSLRFVSGVAPLLVCMASIAIGRFPYMHKGNFHVHVLS